MSRQHAELMIGSSQIRFVVTRSDERDTVAVSVHPTGDVTVKAPKGARLTRIQEQVSQKSTWILEQQEHFRRLHRGYPRQFISGESFYYMGRQYKLKVRRSRTRDPEAEIRMFAGSFEVWIPREVQPDERANAVRELLVGWYRDRALVTLVESSDRYTKALGIESPEVRLRQMPRRWGSAKPSNRVTYNWQIIMAPKRLIEYVAAHEVCHLIHHDHSKAFWRLLERIMPDYETRRQELAIHGAKYQI